MMSTTKFITKNHPKSKYLTKYHDYESYYDVINYIYNQKKTQGFYGGWAVNLSTASYEMDLLTHFYGKHDGIKLRHWVVSFTPEDIRKLCAKTSLPIQNALFNLGYYLTSFYGNRHQIVFAVHWVNEAHPHIHIVMNTTSYMDGLKFHGTHEDFHAYERFTKEVLSQYGISNFTVKDHASTKYF